MKERIFVIILVLFCVAVLVYTDFGQGPRVYDCSMADWHPDIPKEVRDKCRKLRYEQWEKENIEQKHPRVYI